MEINTDYEARQALNKIHVNSPSFPSLAGPHPCVCRAKQESKGGRERKADSGRVPENKTRHIDDGRRENRDEGLPPEDRRRGVRRRWARRKGRTDVRTRGNQKRGSGTFETSPGPNGAVVTRQTTTANGDGRGGV